MKTLTTEQFIEKARSVHGDKYDYSKVNYINSHAKVVIICPIHGEFEQSPNSHLKGSGCPCCCTNNHKCTKEEFIEKARSIHGDKYDYSKVDYVNNETKVCIVCAEHGEFFMKPTNHLIGQGCKKCYHEHKDLKYNTKSIIKKFRQVHGDKYDYSKVNYKGITTKVTIGCPIHGDFEQIPSSHLSGSGCPQCGMDKLATMKRYNNEEFIEKARSIHGDKYDYSKVNYKNNKTKICIVCPIHGEFYQRPDEHLKGRGCLKCCGQYHYNTETFIMKANEIHHGYFSYDKTIYTNARSKVIVTCPIHGDFEVKASNHLLGYNCSKCEKEGIKHLTTKKKQTQQTTKKLTNETIVSYINNKYGDLYDTSLITYVNNQTPIEIICNNVDYNNVKHGKFSITPNKLLSGQGCPKCGNNKPLTIEEFINKSNFIHQNKYNYNKSVYVNTHTPLTITCYKHGDFQQSPANHLKGQGCPKCGNIISLNEDEIYNYICDLVGSENVIRRDRSVLDGKEIDIYIPQYHLGIEYHGCLWHSTKYKDDKNYHLNKYIGCKEKGVQLLQYFEDEYIHSKKIILSRIRTLLNCNNQPVIGGRQTIIKIISKSDCESFINENHIQGFAAASVYIGAFYKDKLIGVMSFKKEKNDCWDLNRCVTDINYRCPGVVGKMFKFFIKNYNFTTIKSFLDLRYGNIDNNIYINLGFQMAQILKPDYHYITNNNIKRVHKFNCRKQILSKKYGLPLTMTEKEMTDTIGMYRIYDVGKVKYIFCKKSLTCK